MEQGLELGIFSLHLFTVYGILKIELKSAVNSTLSCIIPNSGKKPARETIGQLSLGTLDMCVTCKFSMYQP